MAKKKRSNDPFKPFHSAAIGVAGLSLSTAVGASIASKAPAGTPSLTSGFSTLAGFVPIATTSYIGFGVLNQVRRMQRKAYSNKKGRVFY